HPDAIPLIEIAVKALAAFGTPLSERARVYGMLVQAATRAGELDRARAYAEEADELARRSGSPSTMAQISYHLGALWARDEPDRALGAFERSVALARAGANDRMMGAALFQGSLLR